jgi:protein-tyrosine-phosphatase
MINNKLIIFIDRGDISRSPIAASIVKKMLEKRKLQDKYEVISTRTQGIAPDDTDPIKHPNITYYPIQYAQSKKWLDEHKIDLTSHLSIAINSWYVEKADVIFAMDNKTRRSLLIMFPEFEGKVHMFSEIAGDVKEVDDPELVDDEQSLVKIYNGIENTIVAGLPKLLLLAEGKNVTNIEIVNRHTKEILRGKERL